MCDPNLTALFSDSVVPSSAGLDISGLFALFVILVILVVLHSLLHLSCYLTTLFYTVPVTCFIFSCPSYPSLCHNKEIKKYTMESTLGLSEKVRL